jgi:hypothetical protein
LIDSTLVHAFVNVLETHLHLPVGTNLVIQDYRKEKKDAEISTVRKIQSRRFFILFLPIFLTTSSLPRCASAKFRSISNALS